MNKKSKMFGQLLAAIIVVAAVGGFSSCEKYSWIPEKIDPVIPVLFQTEIQPIFNAKCISCHGAIKAPDLRDGHSYEALTTGGYVNKPAETSELYTKITGSEHSPRTNDTEKQKIFLWIDQGAQNN